MALDCSPDFFIKLYLLETGHAHDEPWGGPFKAPCHNLNTFKRGPLHDAIYIPMGPVKPKV